MVVLTSDDVWDPRVLHHSHLAHGAWGDDIEILEKNPHAHLFDEFGDYNHCHDSYLTFTIDDGDEFYDAQQTDPSYKIEDIIDRCVYQANVVHPVCAYPTNVNARSPRVSQNVIDYEKQHKYFAF